MTTKNASDPRDGTAAGARRVAARSRRRMPDAKEMRQQRCRLGTALTGEPKAGPESPRAAAEPEPDGEPAVRPMPRPMPGAARGLLRTTLMIVVAIVGGILLFNYVPWRSVGTPAAVTEAAGPPDSLVRGTRQGVVSPQDYFRVWRQAGVSAISAEDGGGGN